MGNGAGWLKKAYKLESMSPLGEAVADLLDDVFWGIYHVNSHLHKTDWTNDHFIDVVLNKELHTFDYDHLTRLVVLCHDRLLRMEITGRAPNFLTLTFHQRKVREGRMFDRMPTMEDHIEIIRRSLTDVDR